jgi:hypothetical protein
VGVNFRRAFDEPEPFGARIIFSSNGGMRFVTLDFRIVVSVIMSNIRIDKFILYEKTGITGIGLENCLQKDHLIC